MEILVEMEPGLGLAVYSGAGARLGTIRPQGYLTAFHVARGGDSALDAVVLYSYPNEEGGGTFEVMSGEGKVLGQWQAGAMADFGVIDRAGGRPHPPSTEDRLVVSSLQGRRLQVLSAPGAAFFKSFEARNLAMAWRCWARGAATGRTTPYGSTIGPAGSASDSGEERAYGLLVLDDGSILVGTETDIWKYSLAH